MKVVHVCCVAPPEAGGMGAVAYQEVSRLRKLGVDAVLVAPQTLTPSPSPIELSSTGEGSIVRLPAVRIGNVARMFGLDKIVKDADVVHLHYPFYFTSGLIARWRRQNKIKKLVITLHMDATDKGWRWLAAYLHRTLFQKRLLDSADVLLVSTLDYAQNSSFAPWVGTPKLHELPFGVDTEAFRPTNAQHPAFVIGMVGVMDRAHPFKGVDVFLRALAKLPNHVQGLLVGDGDRRKDYELLAKELGISERTKFVGRLDRDKLIEAFQSMDVFAFPSTSRAEAFGLVLLEAMACGVPVIASDLPGVRAVAKDAGLIVPINDSDALAAGLRRMLEDQAWRQSLALAAREKAERFGWQNHVTKLMELYSL
ncbi:MAG: glycosyltransferase family 4 protein [Patescibacteria group bacterium]|nr:glycosyltransferase family 4 protein [Patescibacteria group bacterium]